MSQKHLRNGRKNMIVSTKLSPGFAARWSMIQYTSRPYTVHFVRSTKGMSLMNCNATWITGSSNQKVSNILDLAGSEVHKATLVRKKAEATRACGESVV